jgi:hypothetical protein
VPGRDNKDPPKIPPKSQKVAIISPLPNTVPSEYFQSIVDQEQEQSSKESVSYFSLFDGTEEDAMKLEKLREIVESDEGLELLLRCANNKSDPSVIHINNVMEIFLDRKTKGYTSLQNCIPKRTNICSFRPRNWSN